MSNHSQETIIQIAKAAHAAHRTYCSSVGHKTQPIWDNLTTTHKATILNSVCSILSGKVRTVEQSHNMFVQAKLTAGWTYGTEYSTEAKTNPRLQPLYACTIEDRTKENLFFNIVKSFIA